VEEKNEFLEINNSQIEYVHQIINPDRPTLVFLHEGLGCVAMWRDFPQAVAEATTCNLLVYSRVGYGRSSPAQLPRLVCYMHDEGLETLPIVLEKCQIQKHILIGHSDGGSIALINGGGAASPNLLGIITEAAHVFNEPISVRSIEETRHLYQTTNLREKLARYHANVDNAFWGWNDIWLHPDFRAWNLEAFLPTIDVPLLVMQGLDDQYGTLAQVEAIVTGVGEKAQKCLIPDCRHAPHHEQRDVTLNEMTTFIQTILREKDAAV
jgi:pimeloyl-ACP methyl ester carboxylesterase